MILHRRHGHRKVRLTPLGWLVLVVALGLGLAGVITGSTTMWIVAVIVVLVAVVLAIGIPINVQRLDVPPGMPNAPGDVTRHLEEED